MKKNNKKPIYNEEVDINGSKVFVEKGKVKTILSEEIQQSGYMSLDELRGILHAEINKQEELISNDNSNR